LSSRLRSRLLVITDRSATHGRPLRDVVRAALAGGARLVQLREKDLDGGDLLALAEPLVADCHEVGAQLLVNDRIDVALAARADGVVLPMDSFPTPVARRLLGHAATIGRSTHGTEEVELAAHAGCDFVLFGPVYATPAKAAFGPPQGIERLRAASAQGIGTFAVGGITVANAATALAMGAHGVAVIREVMSAGDPQQAVRALLAALGETRAL
jgi:thiamine-phosphate pyrophosphorylase